MLPVYHSIDFHQLFVPDLEFVYLFETNMNRLLFLGYIFADGF